MARPLAACPKMGENREMSTRHWRRLVFPVAVVAMAFALNRTAPPAAPAESVPVRLIPAQSAAAPEINAGDLLIADRDLADPNFAETVVLLLRASEDGALGLIINHPTKVPLSRLFHDVKEAQERSDPVFMGGPVETESPLALFLAHDHGPDTAHVFSDVYVASSRKVIEKSVTAGKPSSVFRVYLGYAGWAPGQLERELELGGWRVLPGSSAAVFDPNPPSLWSRLIRETELNIAWAFPFVVRSGARYSARLSSPGSSVKPPV
jgi:putative transcriptional regulator